MMANRVLAVMSLIVLLFTGACSSGDTSKDGDDPSPSASNPTSELIEYDGDEAVGTSIAKAADVAKLQGAPADFKQFIAGIVDASKVPADDDCQFTVAVAKVDTSGYAAGSMHSCGGAVYIWAKRDGVWQEIWSGQELPDCADMEKYSVPKAIAGDSCYEDNRKVEYAG